MDLVKAVALIALGSALLWGCGVEVLAWSRRRRRGVRTVGTVVGHRSAGSPGTMQRSGVFEFTTENGQVVQASSSLSTPRGPKIGTRIPVVYDPADPAGTADRPGVLAFKMVALLPVMLAIGTALAVYGITFLM
ncbi:DUF3592 domain-containing protein [Actinomadura sp. 7K507]|uniref:DUF3592 domain-containing protein n=1 Tax=Actinomadura sp. 7K507 TaxID=2530365 RepID=UPI001045E20A|nr:DUF3592 domain-containing protein [Actinomadura sp. 7K507]TDC97496.1 DUF3592 domain-containing protein [Actinomadura sp. 7K507]